MHSAELPYHYTGDGKSTCHLYWIRSPRAAPMTLLSHRPSGIVHLYSPTGAHLMHVWQISPALSLVPHNARDTYPHATLHLLLNQTIIDIIMCLRMEAEARQSWPGLPIKFPCVPVVCTVNRICSSHWLGWASQLGAEEHPGLSSVVFTFLY